MQLKVPVCIDMVERQAGSLIGSELRGDFDSDLTFQRTVERNLRSVAGKVAAKPAVAIDKTRNLGGIAHRLAVKENDVKPDAQARQRPSARNCVGGRGSANHEARRAENAAPVSLLDGSVDRLAEPEIVRGDDQPVQCTNSLWELNCAA
jgi:hypothetical protein